MALPDLSTLSGLQNEVLHRLDAAPDSNLAPRKQIRAVLEPYLSTAGELLGAACLLKGMWEDAVRDVSKDGSGRQAAIAALRALDFSAQTMSDYLGPGWEPIATLLQRAGLLTISECEALARTTSALSRVAANAFGGSRRGTRGSQVAEELGQIVARNLLGNRFPAVYAIVSAENAIEIVSDDPEDARARDRAKRLAGAWEEVIGDLPAGRLPAS